MEFGTPQVFAFFCLAINFLGHRSYVRSSCSLHISHTYIKTAQNHPRRRKESSGIASAPSSYVVYLPKAGRVSSNVYWNQTDIGVAAQRTACSNCLVQLRFLGCSKSCMQEMAASRSGIEWTGGRASVVSANAARANKVAGGNWPKPLNKTEEKVFQEPREHYITLEEASPRNQENPFRNFKHHEVKQQHCNCTCHTSRNIS